jgi:Fe-S-cluster containining protein
VTKLPVIQAQAIAGVRIEQAERARKYQEGLQDTPVCRKGCDHCCYHPIRISVMEGTLLYWHLRNNGLWSGALKGRLEEHSKLTLNLSPAVWLLSKIPCPLLQDSQCVAYKARPFLCRTNYSTGDPDLCHPARLSVATPMPDRQEDLVDFYSVELAAHKGQGAPYWRLPLSLAVLLGSRIGEGQVNLPGVEQAVLSAYLESQS